jgi:DNA repair protein RecO (recombination protein O)
LMAQLLDRLGVEGESQPELYVLSLELLIELSGPAPATLLELGLKLRFLNDLGYRPELSGCIICRSTRVDHDFFLSPERGGIVCEACRVGESWFSQRAIKLWRLALEVPLNALVGIADAESLARDSIELLDQFYEYHFGRRFTGLPLGV